jgi:hypothetical protein
MNSFWIHIIHQAIFGGIASAGFGILFNCSPRIILHYMGSGAMALAIRTACQSANLNLPESAFFAALSVARGAGIANGKSPGWLRLRCFRAEVTFLIRAARHKSDVKLFCEGVPKLSSFKPDNVQ